MTARQTATEVVLVDYGLGNLRSVTRGLERAGANVTLTDDPADIDAADGVVLPGVGAFSEGMDNAGPFRDALVDAAAEDDEQVPLSSLDALEEVARPSDRGTLLNQPLPGSIRERLPRRSRVKPRRVPAERTHRW